MDQIVLFCILMLVGFFVGGAREKKHYKSIKKREKDLLYLPVVTMKNPLSEDDQVVEARLVTGNVVVAIDFFKKFLGGLIQFFGGNITSYESLLDRARREAILRMKESATDANIIINLRIETSSISKSVNKGPVGVEIIAYGTAIRLAEADL